MRITINFLPREVLVHIFSFLDVHNRLVAALVCKQWLHSLNSLSLLKNICIKFENDSKELLENLFSMTRKFPCLVFKTMLIDDLCIKFLRQFSEQFYFLSFQSCELKVQEFNFNSRKINKCTNLGVLEFINCNLWLIFISLPSLYSLHIIFDSGLNDSYISQIQTLVPKLYNLTLSSYVTCDVRAYRRFYNNNHTFEDNPSDAILSFPAILSFIRKYSETLIALDLTKTNISPSAALDISNIENLKLQSVSFTHCVECSNILDTFCQNQSSLISLDFGYLFNLTDTVVTNICHLLPNVQDIYIMWGFLINKCINDIFHLQYLRKIDITGCSAIVPSSFEDAVSTFQSHNLQVLNLCGTKIYDSTIYKLLLQTVNVTHLNLSLCCVLNNTLNMISCILKNLRSLVLRGCVDISDEGLTGRPDVSPTSNRNIETTSCLEFKPLSKIKGLLELDLSLCHKITDTGVIEAIQFQNLQLLNLEGCQLLTSLSEDAVRKHNPSLRKFIPHYDTA